MKKAVALAMTVALLVGCSKDSPQPVETAPVAPEAAPAPAPGSAAPSAPAQASAALPSPSASASASASASSSASAAAANPLAPRSSVRLLDPGHEPRRTLRYAWHPDHKELMTIVLGTTVSAESPGEHRDIRLPPLHVLVAIDPQGVSPEGDLGFTWRVTSAAAEADAGAPADVAQGWSAQIAPVEHLSGRGVVTSRGLTRGVTLDAGAAGDAGQDAEMVVQVLQMLRDVAAPLPEEPVGKGARWQKLSTLDVKNSHATETDTFTLTELKGDRGALEDVVAQTASPQALPALVGVPTSTPARVDSLLMSGSARTRFDLTRFVPQTTLDATTSMALSASTNHVNMVMRLSISIQGSPR